MRYKYVVTFRPKISFKFKTNIYIYNGIMREKRARITSEDLIG